MKNQRLIAQREKRQLTQEDLARRIGLTQSMIAHIEAGRRAPSWKFRVRLARFFGVAVDWLFFEPDDDRGSLTAETGTEGR